MATRRTFLRWLLGLAGLGLALPSSARCRGLPGKARQGEAAEAPRLLLEVSDVAAFRYHSGQLLWPRLQPGDRLALARSHWNRRGRKPVEIWWQGELLGYLPPTADVAVAPVMDRGEPVHAVVSALTGSEDPSAIVNLEVWRNPSVRLPPPRPV